MSKSKRYKPEFKAKVTFEALKGEQTVSELASWFGVYPTPNEILGSITGRRRSWKVRQSYSNVVHRRRSRWSTRPKPESAIE